LFVIFVSKSIGKFIVLLSQDIESKSADFVDSILAFGQIHHLYIKFYLFKFCISSLPFQVWFF